LATVPNPRLIFVGSSSVAFGLDSQRLQDSLHINVINAGVTSGIGFRYMVDDVVSYAREGDIIAFTPIYIQFFGGADGASSGELTKVIDYTGWKNLKMLNTRQLVNVLYGIPGDIHSRFVCLLPYRPKPKNSCSLEGYNAFGDEVNHWDLPSKPMVEPLHYKRAFDVEFAEYFVEQMRLLEKKKVRVVMVPPPIVETGFTAYTKWVYQLADFLEAHGYPYMVDPKQHVQPDECYYDGIYHMTKQGVDIYNSKLIEELRPIVDQHLCQIATKIPE
jgi:hypothetical protein